jgi:hypothetical protein
LVLADLRGGERSLRASWHPRTRTIVVSHWTGDICTASNRLALPDGAKLIGFLVGALEQAATAPVTSQPTPGGRNGALAGFAARAQTFVAAALRAVRPRHPGDGAVVAIAQEPPLGLTARWRRVKARPRPAGPRVLSSR